MFYRNDKEKDKYLQKRAIGILHIELEKNLGDGYRTNSTGVAEETNFAAICEKYDVSLPESFSASFNASDGLNSVDS